MSELSILSPLSVGLFHVVITGALYCVSMTVIKVSKCAKTRN